MADYPPSVTVDELGVARVAQPWRSPRYAGGRHIAHDPRSRDYRADTRGVRLRAVGRVVHRHYGRPLDQGRLGSCTGNSGRQVMNCEPLHRRGERVYREEDAVELYSAATRVDPWRGEYPPTDTGSSGLAVGKALRAAGEIDSYVWGFGIEDTIRLAANYVLSVGTEWTDGMFDPDENGFIRPTGDVVGGHQWTIRGVDVREEWFLLLNSWGIGWGGWLDHEEELVYPGHARISFDDVEDLLDRGGDVIRFVRTAEEDTP